MKFYRNLFYITLLSLVAMSCKSSKSPESTENNEESADVLITIRVNADYCGGAAPPVNLSGEPERSKSRLFVKKEIYYVSEGKEISTAKKATTDQLGKVTLSLKPGNYNLFLPSKLTSKPTRDYYAESCAKWKSTPNGKITVAKGENSISTVIRKTCNACYDPAL